MPARHSWKKQTAATLALALGACGPAPAGSPTSGAAEPARVEPARGVMLGELTWLEAEARLGPETVVAIPLGAGSKEHGPHLRLRNDEILAEYFKKRVLAEADVVMAPTVRYHFYPAFAEYPGSISLRFATARALIVDICRSLAAYGPRRFYVINTGISTNRPLRASAEVLAAEGITLRFTDLIAAAGPAEEAVREQERGTHADEIETSMLLYIDPESVDMAKAVRDDHPKGKGGLTRDPKGAGTYSRTGIWGDPTLATREKGERVVEALVAAVLADIEELRKSPILHPTPYTREQLANALRPGVRFEFRVEDRGRPPEIHRWEVVSAPDPKSVELAFTEYAADGETVLEHRHTAVMTHEELRRHAEYPEDRATREALRLETAMGPREGLRFTVRDPAAPARVEVYEFAADIPGPPVRLEVREDGVLVESMVMISRTAPSAGDDGLARE